MSDAVAIVAVVSSSAFAIVNVAANVITGGEARRWQSHEARVAELRDVLDVASASSPPASRTRRSPATRRGTRRLG